MANSDITGLLREINAESFLKSELSSTLDSLRQNLNERYVKRMKNTINSAQNECIKTPTKEAGLLMAMREFAVDSDRYKFDRAIDLLNQINTISIIQNDINELQSRSSVHSLSGEGSDYENISPNLAKALLILSFMDII
ncbi:MAG: hypothetical protein IAC55_06160 [Tyzzerella sp.]|uniref:Uncharacterized protein n=1 Tax=Candidatus Fimicola merdigallinarum TaxID=2840819 RepID=A0A9D9H165_9FIRM|nr:hypothetical protein [Candidatus Fimicola merdigallinarum]